MGMRTGKLWDQGWDGEQGISRIKDGMENRESSGSSHGNEDRESPGSGMGWRMRNHWDQEQGIIGIRDGEHRISRIRDGMEDEDRESPGPHLEILRFVG